MGRQSQRAQQGKLTVGTPNPAGTITVTVGGRKSVVVAPSTTNATTTAAELAAACEASQEREFAEIAWVAAGAVVTFTGPGDGAPIDVTKADAGGNATTLVASAVAPLSPNDLGDPANYSGNALPAAGDDLVFERGSTDAKYNAAALAAVALASVTRRASFTGALGLPAQNPGGYVEYRAAELELDAPVVFVEMAPGDGAEQVRVRSTASAAVTLTVQGDGAQAEVGAEVVQVRGLPAGSVLRANGGSVQVAALAGHAAALATVLGQNATVWLGPGVTLGAATLTNCTTRLDCTAAALTLLEGGTCDVRGAASIANAGLKVYAGTVQWRSTGSTGDNPLVGTGAVVDFAAAPSGVAVGGTVALYPGAAWTDPTGKITTPYTVRTVNCRLGDVALVIGVNKTLAIG